jgi:hypothetical protein
MENVNDIEVKDFIVIKTIISREVLENIFVTAIEGGSNYWYYIPESEVEKIEDDANGIWGKSFSERLFEVVYDKGIDIDIYDIENPDDILGTLSRSTMEERLNACPSWALRLEMEEQGDANSSDVVFQCLTMGEVIFG